MRILSHRGYWQHPSERNTREAFERSFQLGFGTETDLRDFDRRLVVSHDMPDDGAMPVAALLDLHKRYDSALPLALNIKADGLQRVLTGLLAQHRPSDVFVFDMSIPDTLQWLNVGVPVFARHSDVEPQPALYAQASGVWLDSFGPDWWTADDIRRHLDAGKRVCIVSPELHMRDHRPAWEVLASAKDVIQHALVMICTDIPEQAREVFGHDH